MHAAQTQAMRMCSRHEQCQRYSFCIFIRAPRITRSMRFGEMLVRRLSSEVRALFIKKRSSARWIIFLVLSVTLFGGRMRYIVSNAGSFNFVPMPVHWNKNGEVSIKPRVTTPSQRSDYLFTHCSAPPSPKSLLDMVKRIYEAPGRHQYQAFPCWVEPSGFSVTLSARAS